MNHIKLAFWAFIVLWQFKSILWIDRLRLWRKTLNLFTCFLAFTDMSRPYRQLHGAMLNALLSALYDYETDWQPIGRFEDSLYLRLLAQEAHDSSAYTLARDLFITDLAKRLSEDGLERGSTALVFYHSLIQSAWLGAYHETDIRRAGRCLQIIDDLLDREEDAATGNKNCLLGSEPKKYLDELRRFLSSGFFQELARRSSLYRKFERSLRRELGERVPLNAYELIDITRPLTVVFAFVLTCLGFKFAYPSLFSALPCGILFACITGNIMVFNDICDEGRDLLKGKRAVHDYTKQVRSFYWGLTALTGVLLLFSILLDWKSGLLGSCVWGCGILYSTVKLRYPWNNLLVAACSGAPVLAGMAYAGKLEATSWFLSFVIFGMITIREVFKDIQDVETDPGNKDTFPVGVGVSRAALHGARLGQPVMILACCYPNTFIQLIPVLFAPSVAFFYLGTLYYRQVHGGAGIETYQWVERATDIFLAIYITAFWFT